MPLTSPGNDDDTGENHQPTLRKNTAEPVEQTLKQNTIQDRLEALAAPRTAQLARRAGPDMAYLNKTLARIAGVEPEDDETRQADED